MEQERNRPGRKTYLLVALFAFALVLLPFLFWRQTWFGRPLADEELAKQLADLSKPRQSQHALVQIGERLNRGDKSVSQFYPQVVTLAGNASLELRQTAAWIMGQDRSQEAFRDPLHKLLSDPEPMVRRNAALALANFRDDAALPELRAMLQPTTLMSPVAGTVRYRLKEGEFVNPGTLVARVGEVEVRAKVPGAVRALEKQEGATIAAGDALAVLAANDDHAWEALRALYLIGKNEDMELAQRYARGFPGMPDRLRQQATLTLRAIQDRK
jgi:multidrug efflux pump subunit AcrA (membrane-fusion protein)